MKNGLVMLVGVLLMAVFAPALVSAQSKADWRYRLEVEATTAVLAMADAATVQSEATSAMQACTTLRSQIASAIPSYLGTEAERAAFTDRLNSIVVSMGISQDDLTSIRSGIWKEANDAYDQGCSAHSQFNIFEMEMMWRPMATTASDKYQAAFGKYCTSNARFGVLRSQVLDDLYLLQSLWCDVEP